jgi:hypothetical protein
MVDTVRTMLYQDADAQVVANCLQLLTRLEPPARLAADKALVYHLLNRLRDFSEWAQCAVLELVAHHRPTTEGEVRLSVRVFSFAAGRGCLPFAIATRVCRSLTRSANKSQRHSARTNTYYKPPPPTHTH